MRSFASLCPAVAALICVLWFVLIHSGREVRFIWLRPGVILLPVFIAVNGQQVLIERRLKETRNLVHVIYSHSIVGVEVSLAFNTLTVFNLTFYPFVVEPLGSAYWLLVWSACLGVDANFESIAHAAFCPLPCALRLLLRNVV